MFSPQVWPLVCCQPQISDWLKERCKTVIANPCKLSNDAVLVWYKAKPLLLFHNHTYFFQWFFYLIGKSISIHFAIKKYVLRFLEKRFQMLTVTLHIWEKRIDLVWPFLNRAVILFEAGLEKQSWGWDKDDTEWEVRGCCFSVWSQDGIANSLLASGHFLLVTRKGWHSKKCCYSQVSSPFSLGEQTLSRPCIHLFFFPFEEHLMAQTTFSVGNI